ncbi:MAG: phosphoenolpyruvate--protein phosphotransferase [Acidobacteriota bacterium]|nr:MAG: phosphoenolpyruvate--protein phosphotransferase [Acidobacteriota bacterium]
MTIELSGIGVSHGIAIGRAMVLGRWQLDVPHYRVVPEEVPRELRRLARALKQARGEIEALRDQTKQRLGAKYAAIFDAHLLILDDRKLLRETRRRIRERRMNSEWAVAASVQQVLDALMSVDDPYIRERGGDITDVHERLQRIFLGQDNPHHHDLQLTADTVVVAHALNPSDAVWLHQAHIVGFVTEAGGKTSHTAILANALDIPAVLGVDEATRHARDGDLLVVDGHHGMVIVEPDEQQLDRLTAERAHLQQIEVGLVGQRGPAVTRDGIELRVAANIEFPEEMTTVRRVGAQGVGLYRSEFLFLTSSPQLPSEEDHVRAYRQIAERAEGELVVIRTLDLGGEKYFHEVLDGEETNPVLGMRAVRFCLARPDIFRTQLRGLLKVAHEVGNVWIMVPMISGLAEWRAVKSFFETIKKELREEGIDPAGVPLGCMIEVPSAALVADQLAREASFLSIGTNDLVQYTLAVDRNNLSVSYLNDPWHPAVMRLVRDTIAAGHAAGTPVSLCGEFASDPFGALTLLGLGLTMFSCTPTSIPEIRSLLRAASAWEAKRVVEEAMRLGTGREIRERVEDAFGELVENVLGPELSPLPAREATRQPRT